MTPVVRALILANFVGYGLQYLLGDVAMAQFALWPSGNFLDPDSGAWVGFRPWQLISYAFLHDPDNILHLLLNMFALWMFGRDVERGLGSRVFSLLYFASVLAAGLVQFLVVSWTQQLAATVGASGGVFGVLLAFAVLFPKRKLFVIPIPIPMPAWFLVSAYGVIELAMGVFGTQQGVAHFAHLGGMVGAAVVLFTRRR